MSAASAIRIVDYAPQWRTAFARLNLEWLEAHFVVEPIDRIVLLDPETHILEPGGRNAEGAAARLFNGATTWLRSIAVALHRDRI